MAKSPLEIALGFHGGKTPVGANLNSQEWAEVAVGLRNMAQFTSTIEDVRVPAMIQRDVQRILDGSRDASGVLMDRSQFIRDLTDLADGLGLKPQDPKKQGGLQDITTEARAKLIYEQQTGQAYGFANWKAGQDPDLLEAAPAQELVRIREAKVPRDWVARWAEAGEAVGWSGAVRAPMVALKSSPIWAKLSRFGNPWPPFDFNSGMWVEDVMRGEAERLGLDMGGVAAAMAEAPRIDDNLQASVAGLDEGQRERLKNVFGDQIRVTGEKAEWVGNIIQKHVQSVMTGGSPEPVWLGNATVAAETMAKENGVDISGLRLLLDAAIVKKSKATLSVLDYKTIPIIWRDPDVVSPGRATGELVFEKEIIGRRIALFLRTGRRRDITIREIEKVKA